MDIAIFSNGLTHTEDTLELKSLGGSETAALMVAKKMALKGHCVTLFSRHPAQGEPDYIPSGTVGKDGVRYCAIEEYPNAITGSTWDLLIVSRDTNALGLPHQATKAVLWLHDLATEQFAKALQMVSWNIDEIWTVSEFHRRQVHEVTDFGLDRIHALRNGIIDLPEPEEPILRDDTLLYYGSRPERGLAYLVAPGGIMERLPEFRLEFSMYGNPKQLPEHVQALYKQLFAWAARLPNVTFIGSLTQAQVRDKLREAAALVYPSDFEETSCILAREAISVKCPIIACEVGALPETVKDCGFLFPARRAYDNDVDFCTAFAGQIQGCFGEEQWLEEIEAACERRQDLTWDGVAHQMLQLAERTPERPLVARAKALVEVGDVIPALALLETAEGHRGADAYKDKLLEQYVYVLDDDPQVVAGAYSRRYSKERPTYGDLEPLGRFKALVQILARYEIPENAVVLDWGCCEGNQIINLAARFPKMEFIGLDHSAETFKHAGAVMDQLGCKNVSFVLDAEELDVKPDVILLTEVLEHQKKPWELIDEAERVLKRGGLIVTTTPIGPWEAQRIFFNRDDYEYPEHLWHLDKNAMETMCERKQDFGMTFVPVSICERTMLMLGNFVTWWRVKNKRKTVPLDPLEKALKRCPRIQTIGACIIAQNSEDDILPCLRSLSCNGIRDVSIALGPSTDATKYLINYFVQGHPWMNIMVINVPKIEAGKFGFDDARNASFDPIAADFDWMLWIDTDEILLGQVRKFARENHFASLAICQHHFSCDPRGAPAQIDRPARLIRPREGFRCIGKIHEHFETALNAGPGRSMVLPDCDIFHKGYKTEMIRRQRFERNLPFLLWDMEVYPDRKLSKYLWLRDLIHQMRYASGAGDQAKAAEFAEKAITHYNEFWKDMLHFGNGLVQGFQYVSEARRFLGRGAQVNTMVSLGEGRSVQLQGMIEEPNELTRLIEHILSDECKRVRSRYR